MNLRAYLYTMAVHFTIDFNGSTVKVSGGHGHEYWELIFEDGTRDLLDPGGDGWVFVDDELKDLDDAEIILRNAEANLLGQLLIKKAAALNLDY